MLPGKRRSTPPSQQSFFSRNLYQFLGLIAVSIFLLHYALTGQAVYGDGIGYYAHLRSWVFDQDWDNTNEYRHLYTPQNNNSPTPELAHEIQIVGSTQEGKAANHYSPGPALLLLPFYLTAHALAILASALGLPIAANGFSDIYQIFTGLGSISYVLIGLWLMSELIFTHLQNRRVAELTVATLFLATPLLYYGSFDVINSHFASFFLTALFFAALSWYPPTWHRHYVLGLIAGLLTSARVQDGVAVIIWLIFTLQHTFSPQSAAQPASTKPALKNTSPQKLFSKSHTLHAHRATLLRALYFFSTGFLTSLIPMIWQWIETFGNPLEHTYIRTLFVAVQSEDSLNPLGSLFHPSNGLLLRTPILLLSFTFFGWLILKRRAANYLVYFLFFLMQFVIISVQAGWMAAAYGGRMYISSLVFFGLIIAELLQAIQKRTTFRTAVLVSATFILLNFFSMGYFLLFEKNTEQGKSGTELRTSQRLEGFRNRFSGMFW